MTDEDLLSTALGTMSLDQPPPGDRVGEVRTRIRHRRARQGAVVASAVVLLAGLGAATFTTVQGGRTQSLTGPPPAVELRQDAYRIPITQLEVRLPEDANETAFLQVEAVLRPLALRPGRYGLPVFRTVTPGLDRGAVRVNFNRSLTPTERARVRTAFLVLPGAQITLADVDGFDLALVVSLSAPALEQLQAGPGLPTSLTTALPGPYGFDTSPDGHVLRLFYAGPALTGEQLASVRREVAQIAGAAPGEVRLLRGADTD